MGDEMQLLRGLLTILVVGILFSIQAVESHSAEQLQLLGPRNCQFSPPNEWRDRVINWDGGCDAGRAHGQGVLRAYKKGETTFIYYGTLEHGELHLGVIEDSEGYLAGQFVQGKVVPNPDRNVIISAFRNASSAAKAYAQRLKQAGNHGSSGFYLKKSQELGQQMD
jgi:hypothetical protein